MVLDRNEFGHEDLDALVHEHGGVRVSIYLATDRTGQDTPQDVIRLKNLLKSTEQDALARGLRSAQLADLLKPASDLLTDTLWWQGAQDGLAIFLGETDAWRYRLSHAFAEHAVVNDRFHIEPLLPMLTSDGRFYVLALSQKHVRLLSCNRHECREVEVPNMPASVDETLKYDEFEPQVRYHSGTPTNIGAAMFYGQGSTSDFAKKEAQQFFRSVDAAVTGALKTENAPLVLAGLPHEMPLYREVSRYPHLAEQALTTGTQLLSDDELQRRAWNVIAPAIDAKRRAALDKLLAAEVTGHTSRELPDIVVAAVFARIDTLFVATGVHVWGTFDPERAKVEPHAEKQPGDQDLLDVAAAHALLSRATVYSVPAEEMPDGAPAAALLRY
jgi:hypothetical protein